MKSYKRLLAALFALSLLLSFSAAAFAVTYSGNNVRHGLPGIRQSDTLTLPENTIWASLTATWGVRVIFLDWRDSEITSVLVPEGESSPTPNPPAREGYIFTGWTRFDNNGGIASLNGDSVSNVKGPGPLVYKANYRTVRADGQTNGTVTVINTTHSKDYVGYRIFDAEISPGNTDAITYSIRDNSPWFDFVKDYFDLTELNEEPGKDEETVTVYQVVKPKDDFDIETFYKNLPTQGKEPDLLQQIPNRDGVITWDEVPFGYYAITSSLGSWVTVNTNNPFATVIDKNQGPQLDKNIIEDGEKKKVNDASFGDHVIFDIEVTASNYKATELITYYHIKDTIGDGFDYDFTGGSNVTVTVTDTQEPVNPQPPLTPVNSLEALKDEDSGYVFLYNENDPRSFEIVVKWATLNANGDLMPISPNEWNHIDVTYSATVNQNAFIAGGGNLNTASFTYDKSSGFDPENPPTEEPTPNENTESGNSDITTTYVYALAIEKVDAEDNNKHLAGVKFTTDDFKAQKTDDDGVYEVIADSDTTSTAAKYFEVPESGFILIKGLASGEYSFQETYTLPGYNLLPKDGLKVSIPSADSESYISAGTVCETDCAVIQTVANSTGIELPSTGGTGTKLFVIIGSVTLLTTVVILVSKKRMYNETI